MLTLILTLNQTEQRDMKLTIPRLRSSAFVHNEYFGKIHRQLCSEQRQRTKKGISFMYEGLFLSYPTNTPLLHLESNFLCSCS
jgi:hypothetical protein